MNDKTLINRVIPFGAVFPGQGSQRIGMLNALAKQDPEIQILFTEASDVLGYHLWQLIQTGPAETLNQTIYAQPALLVADYAVWRSLQHRGISFAMLAGHSLGEYAALLCADALFFTDALNLVVKRAHYMQEATAIGQGAMAAIMGLEAAQVSAICEEVSTITKGILSPANFNSPQQTVIAGETLLVEQAICLAKAARAKAVRLPVTVPSHCLLMKPAAEALSHFLATIPLHFPSIPVISNVEGQPYPTLSAIRTGLISQLYSPVQWVTTMRTFMKAGISMIVECGPGKVLTGLNKRIQPDLSCFTTDEVSDLDNLSTLYQEVTMHAI